MHKGSYDRGAVRTALPSCGPRRSTRFPWPWGGAEEYLERPILGAGVVFVGSFALYLYCLLPSVAWSDGASYQKNCALLRIGTSAWSHPLYVLIGKLFTLVPIGADLAYRVNLVSAVFGALTVGGIYYLNFRAARQWVQAPFFAAAFSGVVASGWLATCHTFWLHAVVPEVYTLHAFFIVCIFVVLFIAAQRHNDKYYLLAWLLVGLSLTNHLLMLLSLPAFALYAVRTLGPASTRATVLFKKVLTWSAAVVLGASFYWVPFVIRLLAESSQDRLRLVKEAVGAGFLNYVFPLGPGAMQQGMSGVLATYGFVGQLVFINLLPHGVVLGCLGLSVLMRRVRSLGMAVTVGVILNTLFAMNFFVRDQFAFLLSSYVWWAPCVGAGGLGLMLKGIEKDGQRHMAPGQVRWWVVPILVAVTLIVPITVSRLLPQIFGDVSARGQPFHFKGDVSVSRYLFSPCKRGDLSAYQYGQDTLGHLEYGAWVVAPSQDDYDAWAVLDYFHAVEGIRPDITLFVPGHVPALDEAPGTVYLLSLPEGMRTGLYRQFDVRQERDLYRLIRRNAQGR